MVLFRGLNVSRDFLPSGMPRHLARHFASGNRLSTPHLSAKIMRMRAGVNDKPSFPLTVMLPSGLFLIACFLKGWIPMRIELVIFDCDGVIADSELISASVLIEKLAETGLTLEAEDVRREFLGRSFPTVARVIREHFGHPLPEDFEAEYRRRLLLRFESELRPTPGFQQMLQALHLPVCVATSSSPPRVERTLQLVGLSEFFGDRVYTASQVTHGKPAPDLFLFAAGRMGVKPSAALVVEDSAPGLMAAQAAHMKVLAYHGGAHLRETPPDLPPGIPGFDNWADFPHLLRRMETIEECR